MNFILKFYQIVFLIGLSYPWITFASQFNPNDIYLPPGFHIAIYADPVPEARGLALGKNGIVFVGSKDDKVYALIPNKQGTAATQILTIVNHLKEPHGVAYLNGSLYVGEINRILRYDHVDTQLTSLPIPTIIATLPDKSWHGMRPIGFSPDNLLYVAIGMPCNTCNYRFKNPLFGTIARMQRDGSQFEIYARGIRNSVGFDWQPKTNVLWFTDNGQDYMGDELPPDEINRAPKPGMDFGFPYVYGNNVVSPDYQNKTFSLQYFTPPVYNLPAHVAALGMKFYRGNQFPKEYKNQIFIAEHGSWNRSKKIGYQLITAFVKNNKVVKVTPFAWGWLQGEKVSGRPVDLQNLPDGSLLVSDDFAGRIYRIYYQKDKK